MAFLQNRNHESIIWLRRGAVAVLVAAAVVIVWALPMKELAAALQRRVEQSGAWGMLIFLAAYVVFSVLSLPVWPMPFAAGAAFGTIRGALIASASCVLAASVCFLIARRLRGSRLQKRLEASPRIRAIQRTVQVRDWKVVAAVRLSHLLTFGLQNYAFGLTRIEFRTFLVATWLATLPGTVLQAYVGDLGFSSVGSWQAETLSSHTGLLRIGGLFVLVAAVGYIGARLRSAYRVAAAECDQTGEASAGRVERRDRSWSTAVLVALGLALGAAAGWCAVRRDALRESISVWVALDPTVSSVEPLPRTRNQVE